MMKKTKENNDKEDNMKEMKDNIDETVKSYERNKIKEWYETNNNVIRMSMNIIKIIKNENVLNLENELGNDINSNVKVKNSLFLYILIMFDIYCVLSDNTYSFMFQILSLFCVLYLGKHIN